jgi:dTDP-L-rhamnose 4-epimerase
VTDVRVLVTGGAGFIGSHVVEAFVAAGDDVVLLDALLPSVHGHCASIQAPDGVEAIRGDIRDRATIDNALRGVDVVCHQAAMVGLGKDIADLPDYVGHNDMGTAVLLAAMAAGGVRQLVLASSMVVYGEGRYRCALDGIVRASPREAGDLAAGFFEPRCPRCRSTLSLERVEEDTPADPRNIYAATKIAQEFLAASWARETSSGVRALRYHNVYGPRMPRDTPYAGVAALFRSELAAGRPPRVFEDGRQVRDFVHVTDIARANVLAACNQRREFRAYNIASGSPCTIGEVATALAAAADGPSPIATGEYRLGDVRHIVADPSRARDELGFMAKVSWPEGIREVANQPMRATLLQSGVGP